MTRCPSESHRPMSLSRFRGLFYIRARGEGILTASNDGSKTIEYDVGFIHHPDVAAVDALARLQLFARRAGCRIRFLNAPIGLKDLVRWMGLEALLEIGGELSLELERETEDGKEHLGVQEEGDPDDPAA